MSRSSDSLEQQDRKRHIPSVDRVLKDSAGLIARWGHQAVRDAIREHLHSLRQSSAALAPTELDVAVIRAAARRALDRRHGDGVRTVINMTGVVLHTNLGRACLPPAAAQAAKMAGSMPNNIEFDLVSGKRGKRDSHVESLICELTEAEAATVVNNNAAAVVLALNTLAMGRQVPVSRGELVEIGGSFRMAEVMAAAGCVLVEVGATNRTRLEDYRAAIAEQTALLLKVHTSNYRVQGFTESVDEKSLAALAHEHKLPCVLDLGSGCLIDLARFGLPAEQRAVEHIRRGVDLLTFSGDKLLGGPQCGIIAGRKELIAAINKNPLKRAMRVDSMILAALSEVLELYRHPETLPETLPTLRQLTRPAEHIEAQASQLLPHVSAALPPTYKASVKACASQVGSGALPVETLPSFAISISSLASRDSELRDLAATLRALPLPVLGRLSDGELLLDVRCLEDEAALLQQLPHLKNALICS